MLKKLQLTLLLCVITMPALLMAQIPDGYYDGTSGLTGDALKTKLNTIIKGHSTLSYDNVWNALKATDKDPANASNIILLYTGRSQDADATIGSGADGASEPNNWNREHVWAKSHGDFGNSIGPGTDLHHLRPADISVNSDRANLDFDNGGSAHSEATECKFDGDSWEPRDAVKGDIARMIFYMVTRYEGDDGYVDLEMADAVTNGSDPTHGVQSTLIAWHAADPVDDFERNRNNIIHSTYQFNRNPFIDHPEFVTSIWGTVAPDFTSSAVTNATESQSYTYNITASGGNGGALTITAPTKPSWLTFTDNGSGSATLTGTPTNSDVGSHNVTLNVSDGAKNSDQTFTITVAAAAAGSTIVAQDFESAASDNWSFTAHPTTYNVSSDTWAVVSSLSSITPQNGSNFWGMRDLDNGNGGGAFDHTLTFDNVNISGKTNVKISFFYYTIGFDGSDYLKYELFEDNVSKGLVTLDDDTSGAWKEVTINVTAGISQVKIVLIGNQNGGTDYGAFDNVTLTGSDAGGGDSEAPTAPTSLAGSNITINSLDLSWTASTDNVGVTAYDVFQDGNLIASPNTNSYSVTGLTVATSYAFTVKAKDAAGNVSAVSNTANITTLADTEAPTAPTSLAESNITSTTVDLSWTASSDNIAVTAYDVFRDGNLIGSPNTNSFNVTGLIASTSYAFTVKAKDAAGNVSTVSNTANVTTSADNSPTTLTPGDIAVIGLHTDTDDNFHILFLVDVAAGTEFNITDNGWLPQSGIFRSFETDHTYTVPAGGFSAGTVKNLSELGLSGYVLATGGDQIIIYQGSTNIFVATSHSTQFTTLDADMNSNRTGIPTSLVNGTTAVAVGAGSGQGDEWDNIWYSGSTTTGSKTELLAAIGNVNNWSGSDISGDYNPKTLFTVTGGVNPIILTSTSSISDFGSVNNGSNSAATTYTVSGENLTEDVIVTAPTHFQVSTDGTNFSTSVTLAFADVNASAQTIHARFSPTSGTNGAKTGNITHTSTGAASKNVAVSGTESGNIDSEAPTAPTSLVGNNITATTVDLSWTASTDNIGVTAYDVFQDGSLIASPATNSYNVTGLTASTAYAFTVKAKDAAGNVSAVSNTANVTTTAANSLLFNDNFDYGNSAGDLVTVSGGNWNSHSGSTAVGYATSSLSMSNYASSGVGGSATFNGSNTQDINRSFGKQTSGLVYVSFLLNVSSASASENYFMHFRNQSGSFFGRFYAKDDSGNLKLGIREQSDGTIVYSTANYSFNTTYLVVLKYDFSGGGASIYVLSSVNNSEPGTADAVSSDGSKPTELVSIAIRQSSNIPTGSIDGMRVGTSWDQLFPAVATPTITTSVNSLTDFGNVDNGNQSAAASYTVSGSDLTADVVVTAPTHFQVSKDGTNFSSSLTLAFADVNASAQTIHARFSPTSGSNGAKSGNITHTSTGAPAVNVAVSGTESGNNDNEAPTAPANLTGSNITLTSVDLSWDASTDNLGVTGYDVFRDGNLIGSPNTNSFNVTGLTPATAYAFTVKAKDAAGNVSDASNTANITTLADSDAPSAPSSLVGNNITSTTVDLSWDASTDNIGVTAYDVFQGGSLIASPATTTYNVTGLTASTTYKFTVKAKDAAGNVSNASNELTVNTPAVQTLLVDENFDYGNSDGNLTAVSGGNWNNHSGSGNVGYVASGLSLTNYGASGVGGAATISIANAEDVNRTFTSQSSGTVYVAALMNVSSVGSGNYFMHFNTSSFRGRVAAKTDGSGGVLFGISASSSTISYGTTNFALNTTYLIVASYEIATGKSNLHVLTAPANSEPNTPEATSTGTSGNAISSIAFRQSSNIPSVTIDGVRVGTNWTDIFPYIPNPTITTSANSLTDFGSVSNGGQSTSSTYTISGTDLNADVVVTAPTHFQVSKDGTNFSSSVTFAFADVNASAQTVHARFSPTSGSNGAISGNITHTSTGAPAVNVAVSGTEIGNGDGEAPTAPTNLTGSNITFTSIDLSWDASTDNIGVTAYDVFRDGNLIGSPSTTSFNVTGLTPATAYAFTVKAKDAAGNSSADSNTANISTLTDSEAPSVPANLVASNITASKVDLSWNTSTDNLAVTGYDVYRDNNLIASPTSNSLQVTGLTSATAYSFTVRARDAAGNTSSASTAVSITTLVADEVTEIFFSEYIEGSSNNKALEIVNYTTNLVNLSSYSIKKQTNGAGNWGDEFALSGSIAVGDVFVIAHSSSHPDIISQADLTITSAAITFNGNDPVGLFKNDVLIDVIGTFDGGSSSFAQNTTLRRKGTISEPNTTYTVAEWDSFPQDTFDGIGSHVVLNQKPEAPSNLQANAVSGTQINLSWTDNSSSENGFVLQRSLVSGDFSSATDINVARNATSHNDTNLNAGTTYYYRLKANGNIDSEFTSEVNATTTCTQPTGLSTSSISTNSVTFNWNSIPGAASFEIVYGVQGAGLSAITVSGNSTSKEVTGLFAGSNYQWRIRTVCQNGQKSTFSAFNYFSTTGSAACAVPTGTSVTGIGNTTATFNWTEPGGATSYEIQYGVHGSNTLNIVTANAGSTSVNLSSLFAGSNYQIRVRSICTSGQLHSQWSDFLYFSTTGSAACNTPSGTSVSGIGNTTATFNWTEPGGAASYEIQYGVHGSNTLNIATVNVGNSNINLTSLFEGTNYQIRIRTICTAGELHSQWSDFLYFSTTGSAACGMPTGTSVSGIGNTTATFNWTEPSGGVSYEIQYGVHGSSTLNVVTANAGTSNVNLTGLFNGTNYQVRIRTICTTGELHSQWSNFLYFSTTGSASCDTPTGTSVTGIGNNTATFNWSTVAGAVSYEIVYGVLGSGLNDLTANAGETSVNLTGLFSGTVYQVRIRAICTTGELHSEYSTFEYFTTTGSVACSPASGLSTTAIGTDQATLNWSEEAGSDSYHIVYGIVGGGLNDHHVAGGSTVASTINSLTAGTNYRWRIRTICSTGQLQSDFSDWDYFTTASTGKSKTFNSIVTATEFEVYPNPSKGIINVNYGNPDSQITRLLIYNSVGTQVYFKESDERINERIDLNKFGKGMYLIRIIENGHSQMKRVVIK